MQFVKFNSLENTYRQNLIDKVQYEGKDGGVWIATEKVHGCNLSFWCDGIEVKIASRTQFVDGTFYNCQAVINRYSQSLLDWHNSWLDEGDILVIYGELYGKGIQKEVEYGEKDFIAFDSVIKGIVQTKASTESLCEQVSIPFVPIIHIGTFEECMKLNNTFKSLLTPSDFEGENNAEGLVIEPDVPSYFNNGSRIYFKNKTESFSEKKHKSKEQQVFSLTEKESDLFNAILEYNTTQRVSNVISKIGEVSNKDFGKILGLTLQDILEEFEKDIGRDPKKEAEDNWKQFCKLLNAEVGKEVRKEFLKVLESK